MDVRASSTVLDTVVFVLLVGVAVAVLAGAGADARSETDAGRVAAETADLLATSTTEVTYDRTARVETTTLLGGEESKTVSAERAAGGTRAELLAAAAVASPRLGGSPLVGTGEPLRAATRAPTRRVLHTREANVQVAVAWRPYPNGTLRSSLTVGDAPPRDADVSVATVTVPSGVANVSTAARRAARTDGYDGVARVVSSAVVDRLFPPAATRDALFSEGPDRALVAHRYRQASSTLGVDTTGPLADGNVTGANERLADGLADRLRADLRDRYESPAAAADAVRAHRVRLVVRTWSP